MLPLPPLELRQLVGPLEDLHYDNPGGDLILPEVSAEHYDAVLDFGCGCGRLARRLIQQQPRPRTYLGLDLHRGQIEWCRRHLMPHASGFDFRHHDVHNIGFNPQAQARQLPFPVAEGWASLVIAWSVFTHVLEAQALYYLREARRVLRPGGALFATFFLFDKRGFPMMQEFQNALYINDSDPTNAVIFDRAFLLRAAGEAGLTLVQATPPAIYGFQWRLVFKPAGPGVQAIELPQDNAPEGIARPPLMPPQADQLGLK